ncbi:MAG: hypothetical protein K9W45_12110 [Candidatus Heimdallarchaeum aukensis]|uniref:Uncharacterized protein n=1 Tax=Candidatus Heimdallarchaeum aukensis TaxID=2876573 RepID=A0A9Y1BLQ7_9ARCH|nr:MAG: hypothetical protein K9W45_12110 [Candidatus Heimdallarchaeum aukensis]
MSSLIVAFGVIVFVGFFAIMSILIYLIATTSRIKPIKGQPKKKIEELMDRAAKNTKLMENYLQYKGRLWF